MRAARRGKSTSRASAATRGLALLAIRGAALPVNSRALGAWCDMYH
jgi:hypothetical protein